MWLLLLRSALLTYLGLQSSHCSLQSAEIANQAKEKRISEEEVVNKIMLEPMPKKSFVDMDELLGALEYLVDPTTSNMTGQQIVIDGGWTVR